MENENKEYKYKGIAGFIEAYNEMDPEARELLNISRTASKDFPITKTYNESFFVMYKLSYLIGKDDRFRPLFGLDGMYDYKKRNFNYPVGEIPSVILQIVPFIEKGENILVMEIISKQDFEKYTDAKGEKYE